MPVVPEVTAFPIALLQRCRPKEQLAKNPSLKSLGPRKQSWLRVKTPLYPAPSLLSPEKPPTQIKKGNILRRRRRSGTGKIIVWQLRITPMPLRLVRRRNGTTEATRGATIAKRRAIFWGTARNLQNTSVGLSNLYAGDWWWWRGCQSALHLLFGSILKRPKAEKLEAGKSLTL